MKFLVHLIFCTIKLSHIWAGTWYQFLCNKDKQVSKSIFSQRQFKLVKCLWLWCLWSNMSNLPSAGLVSQMCSEGIISRQLMRPSITFSVLGDHTEKDSSTLKNVSFFHSPKDLFVWRLKHTSERGYLSTWDQLEAPQGEKEHFMWDRNCVCYTETVVWLSLVAV